MSSELHVYSINASGLIFVLYGSPTSAINCSNTLALIRIFIGLHVHVYCACLRIHRPTYMYVVRHLIERHISHKSPQ